MDYLTIVNYVGKTAAAIVSILTLITIVRPYIVEWWRSRTRGIKSFTNIVNVMDRKILIGTIQSTYDQYMSEHKWDWRPKVLKTKKYLRNLLVEEEKKKLTKKEPKELIISTELPKQKFQPLPELEMSKEEIDKKFKELKNTILKKIDYHIPTGFTKFDHKWTVIASQIEPLESSIDYVGLLERRLSKFEKELKEALERG